MRGVQSTNARACVPHANATLALTLLVVLCVSSIFFFPLGFRDLRMEWPVTGPSKDEQAVANVTRRDASPLNRQQQVTRDRLKDLCYVHVGKSGGGSIANGVKKLVMLNEIRNAVHVHHAFTHNTSQQIKDSQGGLHQWAYVCGPLVSSDRCSAACLNADRVLLWVRDPIARLLSTWDVHFRETKEHFKQVWEAVQKQGFDYKNRRNINLNLIVETIARRPVSVEEKLQNLYDFLASVYHGVQDMAFYLGDQEYDGNRTAQRLVTQRSTSCTTLQNLSIWFVGRTEHIAEDWEAFVLKTAGHRANVSLGHMHASNKQGKHLSSTSVEFLRLFYQAEYACILDLVHRGWLSMEYYTNITAGKKYTY